MARGGISNRKLRFLKAQAKQNKPIKFDGLKLILMNTINPRTHKYYTETEAKDISAFSYRRKLAKANK